MKSFIALTVGLTGTGAGASILDSAIAAPAALHSYIFSMPEPGSVDMLVAAIQRGQRGFPAHPLRSEIEGTWTPGKTTARRRRVPR